MHNVLHIAGLRKRLAAFGLMLVLLGSLFIPYGQLYSASAAEQSVRFKNLKTDENGIVQATNGKWYKVIIPALSEPLVRNLRATTPESESH